MKLNKRKKTILGIFILVGLLIIVGVVYYMGTSRQLFGDQVNISAVFKNVEGLKEGNNVWFSGIKEGVVKEVRLVSDSLVEAQLAVDEKSANFIKKDSYAGIQSMGLMGNKVVTISAGSVEAKSIEEGDEIRTRPPVGIDEIMAEVKTTAEQAKELAANMAKITEDLQGGQGALGKLIYDEELSQKLEISVLSITKSTENIEQLTFHVNQVTKELSEGEGLAAKLINSEKWANDVTATLDSLKQTSTRMSDVGREMSIFAEKLNSEKGAIQQLLQDTTMANDLHQAIINIKKGTANLDEVTETVNNSWLLNLFGGKD